MEKIDYKNAIQQLHEKARVEKNKDIEKRETHHHQDWKAFCDAFVAHKAALDKAIQGDMLHFNKMPNIISDNSGTKYVEVLPGIAMDVQHMIDEMKVNDTGLLDMLYVCIATTRNDDKTWSTWYVVQRTVKAVDYPFVEAAADPVDPYYAGWARHGTNFRYFLMFYYDVRHSQVE